jgi:hypothetical protein
MNQHSSTGAVVLIGTVFGASLAAGIAATLLSTSSPASATPSFARQTGQSCTACHIGGFGPQLTSLGRSFKLNGYVQGEASTLPPISAMIIGSLTSTTTDQPGGAATGFNPNNNLAINQISGFYAGRIYGNLGAWIQVTYDGVAKHTSWDNWDVRYADSGQLFGHAFVAGISANNNPTTQDLWNSTPAWTFPYARTSLAPSPGARTRIDGTYAQQVAGVTAYAMWDDLLYTEVGAYGTLQPATQRWLGTTPGDATSNLAPYWRLALQHSWEGGQYASIGTYGLSANVLPGGVSGSGTDRYTDVGFDATYQYTGDERHVFSLYATFIHESAFLDASFALGNSANSWNELNTLRGNASFYFEQTYGLTAGLFSTWGSTDTGLYNSTNPITGSANGSPNSSGFIVQLDYTPFGKTDSLWAPWLNLRLGLQYTGYFAFNGGVANYDGNGRNAWDNNTVMALAWLVF